MEIYLKGKNIDLYSNLLMVLLCVLMADCAVFGAGRTIMIGSLGFRMVLVGITMLLSVPWLINKIPEFLKNRYLWILAAFAVWLAVETVIGIARGNTRAILASDLKGFTYFAMVLPILCVLNTRKRVEMLMKVIMYAVAVLAVVSIFLMFLHNWKYEWYVSFYMWDIEHNITMFASVTKTILRAFYKSTPYLLCGCAFSTYFYVQEQSGKRTWIYPAICGLSLFALLVSYTRSVYLAVAVAAVFLLILFACVAKKSRKAIIRFLAASILIFLAVLILCSVLLRVNCFAYALDRLLGTFGVTVMEGTDDFPNVEEETQGGLTENIAVFQEATKESDEVRKATLEELWENIEASPIIGHGLGKSLAVRDHGPSEYVYHDICMKTGIVGLVLLFAAAVLMVLQLFWEIRSGAAETALLYTAWLSVLLGFMTFSYFNPYMNASLGILFYCCCIGIFSINKEALLK